MESSSQPGPEGTGDTSVPGPSPVAPVSPGRRSTFWMALWLGVALICCKAYHLGCPSGSSWRDLRGHFENLAIIAHADVLYALFVGALGQLSLWALSRRRRLQSAAWWGLFIFCTLSVFYGIASAKLFEYQRMALTYALLYLAGDMKNMSSSIDRYAGLPVLAAVAGSIVLYVLLSWLISRWPPRRTLPTRLAQGIGAMAILVYAFAAHREAHGAWGGRHADRRIADNPHYVFLASCVQVLFGTETPVPLKSDVREVDLADFAIAARDPAAGRPTPGLKRGPKNVIIIVCESVGTQFLGLYGGKYPTTPRLAAEAPSSIIFDNCYSHITNTANSLVAITLSTYPPMSWREYTVENPDMPGTSLAQALKPLGYRTAFIAAGDNAYANQANFLKNRGFDTLWDYHDSGYPLLMSWGIEDRGMIDMVQTWVKANRAGPFMVMCWTQGTHHPYEPVPGQDEIDFLQGDRPLYGRMWWDLGRYLNALYQMDRQIGRLFDWLRAENLADDTIVLITGDHGEAFGTPHENYGHSGKVYQEDVNVPFIIWNPALFQSQPRNKTIGAHVDLCPTLADLLNVPLPPTWQGRSLFAPSRPPRAYFYGAMDSFIYGVREGSLKYIHNATWGQEELYDLSADPHEQTNLAPLRRDTCLRQRQRLSAWLYYQAQLKQSWESGQRRLDRPPMGKELLKDIPAAKAGM